MHFKTDNHCHLVAVTWITAHSLKVTESGCILLCQKFSLKGLENQIGRKVSSKHWSSKYLKFQIKQPNLSHQRRQWHPTPVLLPGESHGQRSLVGCSPWGRWSWTRLSNFTFTFYFHALEKEMASHSSVLAWRIPGMGKLGGLPSMGSHRVGHNWSDLAAAAVT